MEDSRKNLLSLMKFPFKISFKDLVIFSGCTSVKKPTLPKFIPNKGALDFENFLAELNIVPSPPMQIIRSDDLAIILSFATLNCFDKEAKVSKCLERRTLMS